jgi:exodeoxyribonuclease VII small subunit
MANKQEFSFAEAQKEIETIVESLKSDEINIDAMSAKVERAIELIHLCKEKLRTTEKNINDLLQ